MRARLPRCWRNGPGLKASRPMPAGRSAARAGATCRSWTKRYISVTRGSAALAQLSGSTSPLWWRRGWPWVPRARISPLATALCVEDLENQRITEENVQEAGRASRRGGGHRPCRGHARELEPGEEAHVACRPGHPAQPRPRPPAGEPGKEEALRDVQPVYVERAQMIVRRVDLVTEEHVQILQDLGMLKQTSNYLVGRRALAPAGRDDGALRRLPVPATAEVLRRRAGIWPSWGSSCPGRRGALRCWASSRRRRRATSLPVALGTMLIAILLDAHVAMIDRRLSRR